MLHKNKKGNDGLKLKKKHVLAYHCYLYKYIKIFTVVMNCSQLCYCISSNYQQCDILFHTK